MRLVILFFAFTLFNIQLFLAAPGDDCSTAILVSSNSCSNVGEYSNVGITGTLSAPSCFSTGTNSGMWFSFLASGPVVQIQVNSSTINTAQIALLSNASGCTGTFTEIACAQGTTSTTNLSFSSLTSGEQYFIYVDGVNNNEGTFQLCLTSPSQPSNDQVCNAITLQTNNFCSPANGYSNNGATSESLMGSLPGCIDPSDEINSVYFKFTATGSSNDITVNGSPSGLVQPQFLVFSLSPDCNATSYTLSGCSVATTSSNSTSLSINNLVPGNTYYVMVDGVNAGTGGFQICINSYVPTSTVQNDDCSNATVLCPGNRYYATTIGATPDANVDPYANGTADEWNCNGVVDNSVWFTYTTPSSLVDVNISVNSVCQDLGSGSYPDGGYLQFEVFERTDGLSACDNRSTSGIGTWTSLGNCIAVGPGGPANDNLSIPSSAMQPNTQYYIVVDNYPGCGCDFDFVINGNAGADAGPSESFCIDDSPTNLTGFTPTGGTWTGPGVSTSGTFSPSSAGIGSHVVYYTFGSCTDSKIVTVSGPVVTVSNDISICPGESTQIIGNVSGQTSNTIVESVSPALTITDAGVSSSWDGSTGTFVTSTITPSGLQAGYTFNSITLNITHSWDEDLIIYLTNPCGNTIKLIDANGGSGSDFTNTVFSSSASTLISSGTSPFTGSFIPVDGASAWATFISCSTIGSWTLKIGDAGFGDEGILQSWSIDLLNTVSPPTYVWSPTTNMTNSTDLNPTVTPSSTITYTLTATDFQGCTNSDNVVVTVNSAEDASFTMTPTCDGGTASISGTTGGTFSFTTPPSDGASIDATTGTVSGGTSGGTYDVTYTTSTSSCGASSNQIVVASNSDDASFTMSATCEGGTATITGTPGGSFSFTTSPSDGASIDASSGTVSDGTPGSTYDVSYTTLGSCSASTNVILNTTTSDDASFTMSPKCDGGLATITGTLGGLFSFTNPPSDGASIDASTGTVSGGTSGNSYDITYTTIGTCSASTNQTVIASNNDDATFSMTATCDGGTASISGTIGGTFSFTTPPSDGASIDGSTGSITGGSPSTLYDVTYITGGSCSATSTQTVTSLSADDATFSMTATCDGGTASISGTTGGTFSFTTPPSDGASIDGSTGSITGGSPSTLYDVTYTTGGSCSAISTQTVTSLSADDATFSMTATCDGGTASISGTTGGTFSFTTPPSDGASIDGSTGTVSGGSPSTLYNITYTTNGTCFSSSNTSVTSKPILTPTIICGATDKNSITFDWTIPSGATDFNVAYSVNGGSSVNIGSTTSNSYTVTGLSINSQVEITINTNGSECYDAATQICVSDDCTPSVANFSFEPTTVTSLDPVCEFTNLSENSIGYIWDFGDENSSTDENPSNEYIIGGEGKYNVILIAINEDGCNDTIIKKVSVKEEIIYYVPNAFTPDGDKFNNEFKPVFYSGIDLQSYTMLIFNRYGQLVFETHDVDKGWKGFYGESDVMSQDGVYTYKIDFKHTLEDDVEIITGTVLLMR